MLCFASAPALVMQILSCVCLAGDENHKKACLKASLLSIPVPVLGMLEHCCCFIGLCKNLTITFQPGICMTLECFTAGRKCCQAPDSLNVLQVIKKFYQSHCSMLPVLAWHQPTT